MYSFRIALLCWVLTGLAGMPPAHAQDQPVPPVSDTNDGVAPEHCSGQACLPPTEDPLEECKGQDCTLAPPVDEQTPPAPEILHIK